ncbi:MAG: DUF11 domain-containing protein [Xanthomonadales bacterium]|nr:DUF11 domain-containing protein [Xanthomonadales bacterium]
MTMIDTQPNTAPRSRSGSVAGPVLAALLASVAASKAVAAAGLAIQVDPDAARLMPAGSSTFVTVSNTGSSALSSLRLFAGGGLALTCDLQTRQGAGFAQPGALSPGDSVLCAVERSGAAGRAWQAGLAASAMDLAGNRSLVRHASLNPRGGLITPDQGIVVLLAGGTHVDGNFNGLLDAGEQIDYHYTLYNDGSLALASLVLVDLEGVVACPGSTLAVGAHMVCTRSYTVTAGDAAAGLVFNEVEVVGVDAGAGPVQAGDVVLRQNLAGSAEIRVVKSPLLLDDADNSGFASVGDRLRYTFAVKNSHAQQLTSVGLVEPDPSLIDTPIVCQALTLAAQPWAGNGTGTLVTTDTALCSAEYTVRPADAAAGQALNLVVANGTATFAGPVAGTAASAVAIPRLGPLQVAKVASVPATPPGGSLVYTVTVRNLGSLPVLNVTISDPVPPGLTGFAWTCAGAACPVAAGSGAINVTVPNFAAGAEVVFTINATVASNPPNPILNVVTVTPETGAECAPDGSPPPCRADVPVGVSNPMLPVPLGGGLWLLLLAGLLGLAARFGLAARRVA